MQNNFKRRLRTKRKVVISLHGIRTRGTWQKELSPLVTEQGWIYCPLDFGWYSVLLFIPSFIRTKKVEWFRNQYKEITSRYQDVVPSIIAHSFGTWILCKALEKYEHIKFDKIILCGSIANRGLDWKRLFNRNQLTLVRNDCGKKDFWAKYSRFFAWGSGNAGYAGFDCQEHYVINKMYDLYDHGSVFGYDHFLGEWIPFLWEPTAFSNGKIPEEFEEPISPYDAARWSAITYFAQYIDRVAEAIVREEVFIEGESEPSRSVKEFVILVPRTPGEAAPVPTGKYYSEQSCKRVKFGKTAPRTGHLGSDGKIYDIPTTIHSLLALDHRTNEELVDAVTEFADMLQRKIDSPASTVRGIVSIKRI